ncbi:alpha/beta-hydrolase [Macrolepiota fuliginosa MF-IS2]|uniref:Alpha/beta-hydrolase n=1 Tax=Macrolepiota fuliginosa MF-IS2 TaxID=1400762 RepID=A0A9P5XIY0_9AGAR|nr:alpha/beta-hydrolase [Macrolepiota fuliginosa MF-IS2]
MSRFIPSLEAFAKGTLATAAGLSTLSVGLLWYGQGYLIYPSAFPHGSRTEEVAKPSDYGIPYDELNLVTPDNVTLKCYMLRQHKDLVSKNPAAIQLPTDSDPDLTEDEFVAGRPTIVMFHGNAGNHGHRIPLAKVFYLRMRCNVLMMCYRGYGLSEGSPSEQGLQIDAQTGLNHLLNDERYKQTPISRVKRIFQVLYGQSIGGAVSIDLISKNPDKIAALILENTFTSLPSLIPHALPLLGPLAFLCHQKWDSISKVPMIPSMTPILMLSGLRDEIVPKDQMRILYQAFAKRDEKTTRGGKEYKAGLEHTKYIEFPDGGHNDTCVQEGYWTAVADFIASLSPESIYY